MVLGAKVHGSRFLCHLKAFQRFSTVGRILQREQAPEIVPGARVESSRYDVVETRLRTN